MAQTIRINLKIISHDVHGIPHKILYCALEITNQQHCLHLLWQRIHRFEISTRIRAQPSCKCFPFLIMNVLKLQEMLEKFNEILIEMSHVPAASFSSTNIRFGLKVILKYQVL